MTKNFATCKKHATINCATCRRVMDDNRWHYDLAAGQRMLIDANEALIFDSARELVDHSRARYDALSPKAALMKKLGIA